MSIKTAGLLLQKTPYLGHQTILKVFAPEHGMLTFFAQKISFTPFALIECVYRPQEKEMQKLMDCSLIDPLWNLRQSYDSVLAAGSIAHDLLRTQMPNKKANELFDLTVFYLKKLPIAAE